MPIHFGVIECKKVSIPPMGVPCPALRHYMFKHDYHHRLLRYPVSTDAHFNRYLHVQKLARYSLITMLEHELFDVESQPVSCP